MSDFAKNITKQMAEVVQTTQERTKLLESLKAKGLKTQASIDKYVSNKKWLRDTIYANDVVAFGETELVYNPAKNVWNLDVATTDMFEGNPHAQAWFAKNYPGKDLSKLGKGELARASLKYVPNFLDEVPPPDSNIILKGSTISTQTAPKFGLKTTGAKKKGLYQRLWGHLPGFRSLPDGSLLFSKALRSTQIGKVTGGLLDAGQALAGADSLKVGNNLASKLLGASNTAEGGLGLAALKMKGLRPIANTVGLNSLAASIDHSANERIRKKIDPNFTGSVVGGLPGAPIGWRSPF